MKEKDKKLYKNIDGKRLKLDSFVSDQQHLNRRIFEEPLHRAEIVIYGIDTSNFSFEGRVFLNNRKADQKTPLSSKHGYVGSFYIFGYGNLVFRHELHIERSKYDYRSDPSPIIEYKRINATDAISRLLRHNIRDVNITIVPVLSGGADEVEQETATFKRISVLRFEKIGIITQ